MSTFGPCYDHVLDGPRIKNQFDTLVELMLKSDWLPLSTIRMMTGYNDASISAQLRHMRKPIFWPKGFKYRTFKERRGSCWFYKVVKLPLVEEERYEQMSFA